MVTLNRNNALAGQSMQGAAERQLHRANDVGLFLTPERLWQCRFGIASGQKEFRDAKRERYFQTSTVVARIASSLSLTNTVSLFDGLIESRPAANTRE
jgi:hypothetical protein